MLLKYPQGWKHTFCVYASDHVEDGPTEGIPWWALLKSSRCFHFVKRAPLFISSVRSDFLILTSVCSWRLKCVHMDREEEKHFDDHNGYRVSEMGI